MRRARTTSGQSRLSSQSGGRPSPSRTWYAVSPPTSTRPPGRTRASVLSAGRRRGRGDQGRYRPRGERTRRLRAGPVRTREARHLDRADEPAARGALELTAGGRVRAAGHYENPLAGKRRRAHRAEGAPRLLGPEHAAKRAREARRADQQERPPAQQERAD